MKVPLPRPVVGLFVPTLRWGGAERDVSNLAQGLLGSRFRPRVFVWEHSDGIEMEVRRAGVEVVRLYRRFRFDINPVLSTSRSLRAGRIQLAHGFLSAGMFCVAAAGRLSGKRSVLVSVTSEAELPGQSRLTRFLESWSVRAAPIVVTNSRAAERYLRQQAAPRSIRCVFIPNGVDLNRFRPASHGASAELRAGFGWSDEELVLLTVARFNVIKNHLGLARALVGMDIPRPVRFVWMGDDDGDRAKVNQFVENAGLSRIVEVREEMAQVEDAYRACDLLVHPSLSESLPNVVLEAMACGRPVIASRVGDVAEYVRQGETGWLVDRDDEAALREALRDAVATHPAQLEAMGKRGRERLVQLGMDVGTYVERNMALYDELLA